MPKVDTLSMEDFSDELIESVGKCLREKEEEIDYFVDSWQGSYETAHITVLTKYLNLDKKQAKNILEIIQEKNRESVRKLETVEIIKSSTTEILENPDDSLVENLISTYENFCKDYNINSNDIIPDNFRDIIIFEFPLINGEMWKIPFWQAHFLMKFPSRKKICRDFFISAGSVDMTETLFKM